MDDLDGDLTGEKVVAPSRQAPRLVHHFNSISSCYGNARRIYEPDSLCEVARHVMGPGPTEAASSPSRLRIRRHPWDPQIAHANGHAQDDDSDLVPSDSIAETRNPAAIFLYTHTIAIVFTGSSISTVYLTVSSNPLWRLPFFLSTLSLFHTLEYLTTALYNPRAANTSAFLLNNGRAYNIAHCLAFAECAAHYFFVPDFQPPLLSVWLAFGFVLIGFGQAVRTTAMATAGSNFNHIVQSEKKSDHMLVTNGVYRWFRHPSYFGFFWWGLGTQIVLGNVVCLVGYAVVLWRFFRRRIES